MGRRFMATSIVALLFSMPGVSHAQSYSQPARDDVPRRVFWGDTHLHTNLSADAYAYGNTGFTPEDAFRFARGETLTAANGMKVKLRRPLDFLVVADHAEYLGMLAEVERGNEPVVSSSLGARMYEFLRLGELAKFIGTALGAYGKAVLSGNGEQVEANVRQSVWNKVGARADRYNAPGAFTAFIGYEYSAMPGTKNLHRVVMFRDDASNTSKVLPFSAVDSINPEDLWTYLANYEQTTGGRVLAIPHNPNTSGGAMFAMEQSDGSVIDVQYAETRARWEPLLEATQMKGDSETHPLLSPNDEFADYETWNSWAGKPLPPGVARKDWQASLAGSYARSGLLRGLEIEQRIGANPFKFGMIGSSDSHTALSTVEEDNFFGKFPSGSPAAERWDKGWGGGAAIAEASEEAGASHEESGAITPVNWAHAASGLAAVWAKENTRASLFDAMQRREVYATTGSRIVLRFFGGWDYPADADTRPDYVDIGYNGGVPMGGDLSQAPGAKSPAFIIVAAKDPDGANLDRVQVVKGWVDGTGMSHEKVFDVAWSGNRTRDINGKLGKVGSTVDIAKASYRNTIGAPLLSATWRDPEFDAGQRAFYYVRALEIPTPRWTAYDVAFFGTKMPDNVPMVGQERAYSSPIWYRP